MTLPRDIRDFKNKYNFGNIPLDRRTKEYKNFVSDLGIRNAREFNNFLRKYIKANKPILDRKRFLELTKDYPTNINFKNLIDTNQSKNEYKKYLRKAFSKYSQINITNPKNYVMFSINGNDYRPLNDNNYMNILNTINLDEIEIKEIKKFVKFSETEYDTIFNINFIDNIESIDFQIMEKQEKRKKKEGALFPYFNNQIIDLKRYQIYKKDDVKEYNENCFVYAMRLLGLDMNSLEYIKSFIKSSHLSKTDVKKIAETLNITIEINEIRNDETHNKSRSTVYNKGMKDNYKLCLFENHYFIYDDKTDYTSYSIINHKDIKHRNEWNYIYKSNYDKDKNRTINSLKLISLMIENKDYWFSLISFEDLDYSECMNCPKMPYYNGLDYDTNTATNEIIYTDKDKSSKYYNDYDLVYIDFETYKDKDNNHIPYVLCAYICDINGKLIDTVNYTGIDCGLKLLNKLKNNAILYAHNAKYDYNFLIRHLTYIKSEIKNGGSFKELKGGYHNKKIVIRDTYSYINMKLDKMPKCFMTQEEQKGIKKEIIPYDLYNEERVKRRLIPVEEIRPFLDESKMNEMIKNAKEWNCYIEDGDRSQIEIVIYSIKYCMMDVKILYSCFNRFRETCIEKFEMDVINYITISSFVDAYFKKSGCYQGCFQLGLNVKEFIMKSIVGGRVMTSNNKKWLIEDKILNDFDAVSLYPSAMKRLEGFLLGTPKVVKDLDYNKLKNYDGYFVEIKIKSIGIKRDFPLSSYINENGVRDWNNEMEDKMIVVDKTTLEDLIEYQKIEFEIVRGYYFDNGFNTKITEIISYLFDMRKKLKKEGNPMEIVYKLMMNSAYGKTIQKDIEKKSVFFNDKEKKDVYVSRNYNIINQIIEYEENKWRIETLEASGLHYNACHIGSSILSMSKRIMNEVMTTAEDNGIKIYYQDTDSIHLEDKDIDKLKSVYEDKYKRTLIGKDLGQFHSDLEIKGAKDVYSTGLIALGKKTYIHRKEGYDENGNKINEYHIRMKGINESGIDYYCNSKNIDEWDLYMRLHKGEEVEFDLTAGGDKPIFKFDNKYNVKTLTEFKRKVSF